MSQKHNTFAAVLVVLWLDLVLPTVNNVAAAEGDADAAAVELYARANAAFEAKNYAEAAAALTQAAELDPNPLLVFNLAQALRLDGRCSEALQRYRDFITRAQTDGDKALRAQAEGHAKSLSAQCEPTSRGVRALLPTRQQAEEHGLLGSPSANSVAANVSLATPAPAKPSLSLPWAALGVGGFTLFLGTGSYIWNNERHRRWADKDDFLQRQKSDGFTSLELTDQQRSNDQLLSSIRTFNVLSLSAIAVGAAVTVTSIYILARHGGNHDRLR